MANHSRTRMAAALRRFRSRQPAPRHSPGTLEPLRGWSTRVDDVQPRAGPELDIAVLVYHGVSSSEAQLVADALARPLGAGVRFVSADPGQVAGVEPARGIIAETLEAVPAPYGLVIPGGLAWRREAARPPVLAWVSDAVSEARGVLTVSTGSLLLAATGALAGQEAAGHWLAGGLLTELGAKPTTERMVHGRLLATASGVRSGVEAADRLAKEMRFGL